MLKTTINPNNLWSDTYLVLRVCLCVLGVTVLGVGIEQADTEELRRAVTDSSIQNILYARDAAQLDTLHSDLADLLCGIARIPEVRKTLGIELCLKMIWHYNIWMYCICFV